MKWTIALLMTLLQVGVFSQNRQGFKIIDLAQIELRLLNKYKTEDSIIRSPIFIDSIFKPHKQFWNGYLGDETDFLNWINHDAYTLLDSFNSKNKRMEGNKLYFQFTAIKEKIKDLTGYEPIGEWYVVFCHGATNLGGLATGEMVIDLSNENINNNEDIIQWLPHEFTHQIMNSVNKHTDTTALGVIISEGFATYVNKIYWGDKISYSKNLDYSTVELKQCKKHMHLIKKFFEENKFTTDKKTILKFRSRSYKLHPTLPGAIGYYIGYQIITKYAKKSSWKDVFLKSPMAIYELSGY